jgi:hypothetical protein
MGVNEFLHAICPTLEKFGVRNRHIRVMLLFICELSDDLCKEGLTFHMVVNVNHIREYGKKKKKKKQWCVQCYVNTVCKFV